jgi:hypothetical protein
LRDGLPVFVAEFELDAAGGSGYGNENQQPAEGGSDT